MSHSNRHDYSKLQEKWSNASKKTNDSGGSNTTGKYVIGNGHITRGSFSSATKNRSFISQILCRLLFWFFSKPEILLLLCLFLYLINIGFQRLMPHISDIRNMKVGWNEQLHWFLLNGGWRDPINNIYDMSQLEPYSVVIAGMVKDGEETLPTLLKQLDILACSFDYTHFFVLESNSEDNTRDIIHDWSLTDTDCTNIALELSQNRLKFSTKYFDNPFQTFLYDYDNNERLNVDFKQSILNDIYKSSNALSHSFDSENDESSDSVLLDSMDFGTNYDNNNNDDENSISVGIDGGASKFRQRLNEREQRLRKHHKEHHVNRHKYDFDELDKEMKEEKKRLRLQKRMEGDIKDNNVKRVNSEKYDEMMKLDKDYNKKTYVMRQQRKREKELRQRKQNGEDIDNIDENDDDKIDSTNSIRLNINAQIEKTAFQPINEFPEILELMKRHKTGDSYQIREERYVIYRNFILDHIKSWYQEYRSMSQQNEMCCIVV